MKTQAGALYGPQATGSLDGTGSKKLFTTNSNAIYVSPGYLLYVDDSTLLARRFDASRLEVQGDQLAVEDGVGRTTTSYSAISASATGLLAYSGRIRAPGRRHGKRRTPPTTRL